jgi:hypothetical protein
MTKQEKISKTDYIKVTEPDKYYRKQNWKIAIGLQDVD